MRENEREKEPGGNKLKECLSGWNRNEGIFLVNFMKWTWNRIENKAVRTTARS